MGRHAMTQALANELSGQVALTMPPSQTRWNRFQRSYGPVWSDSYTAKMLDIPQASWSRYVRGDAAMSVEVFRRACDALAAKACGDVRPKPASELWALALVALDDIRRERLAWGLPPAPG